MSSFALVQLEQNLDVKSGCLLYCSCFFAPTGNGTLNKQAGIDYKQLSLLAKINENQSGEVRFTLVFYFQRSSLFQLLTGPCASVCSCGKVGGKGMRLWSRFSR